MIEKISASGRARIQDRYILFISNAFIITSISLNYSEAMFLNKNILSLPRYKNKVFYDLDRN